VKITLGCGVVFAVLVMFGLAHAQAPAVRQWEYRVYSVEYLSDINTPKGQAELNALGREGWELVQVAGPGQIILKRVKQYLVSRELTVADGASAPQVGS
jgi:hypothetical protein